MNKNYRFSFWLVLIFSVLNTGFMLNIHENGLKSMDQFYIQGPMIFLGAILILYLLIFGSIKIIQKENDEEWSGTETGMFILSFAALIYNICIMWVLAR